MSATVVDLFKLVTPISGNHAFESAEDIQTRLKFIGMIQPGEKVDVRNLRIESNTMITPIKRMFFGDSREATYNFCLHTIESAFRLIYSLAANQKISDDETCVYILRDMQKAIQGLVNIQQTYKEYKEDKMFMCKIETLIETVGFKVLDVKQKYPDIYSKSVAMLIASSSPPVVPPIVTPSPQTHTKSK